jgi:hypothetical protein
LPLHLSWRLETTDDDAYMGDCCSGVSLHWLSIPLVSPAFSLRLGNWFPDSSALLFLAPNTVEICKCNHTTLRSVLATCLPEVYVVSGAAWLLYLKSSPQIATPIERNDSSSKWVLVPSALALAALAGLWLPGKGYVLARAKDPESLNIEMWRTDCQIRCPVYKVTIQANGTVDYVGDHFVRDRGPEEVVISKDQIHTLLVDFDQAHFFNLEDRAFAWGFHTSRVGVRITIDGKTKEVWSDTYHIGSKSGLQARFVEATVAIDKAVGTDQWVKCDEGGCVN